MDNNQLNDSAEEVLEENKYIDSIEYRGYTLHIEYGSEGVFYDYQNFENDVLKRAIRFIGGSAMYVANPILGGVEMIGAVISDVFIKEGYEIANKLKKSQGKLYKIDGKIDATVLSKGTASIKYSLNCLKEYQATRDVEDFRDFYEGTFQSVVELSNFLSENKPFPSFMNSVTTLTKLVEEGVKSLTVIPKSIEYKYNSVLEEITHAKELLARQWVNCLKYYSKQIVYGRKKIKKFMSPRVEYYADDKLHGIALRIIYKSALIWGPKELPDAVLKKYVENVHCKHVIRECSMTYEYVKDFIDQSLYPAEKYCANFEFEESEEIKRLIFLARLRVDAANPEDALDILEEIMATNKVDISAELKTFYQNTFDKIRKPLEKSWEEVDKVQGNDRYYEFSRALADYKASLTEKLLHRYKRIIKMIVDFGLPKAKTDESRLFYHNLVCEYKTCISDIVEEDQLMDANEDAFKAYEDAYELCTHLGCSNPSKLSLIKKYTNFLFNILLKRDKAKEILNLTLLTAEDDIDDLKPQQKSDVLVHIQAMKENLKAWKRIK